MNTQKRKPVSDHILSMLKEEVVYICPLGISEKCKIFEKIETPFTNHHINYNRQESEYWNLIRICEPCHRECNKREQDGDLNRKIKLRKKNLVLQYFGPLAINVLKMGYKYEITSGMPCMILKLLEKGYLKIENPNIGSVGAGKHETLQDYRITNMGRKLVEKLNL